ncbi:MAG TPA: cytochrome c biogenesis protein CcdA, partial [Candidatus Norongarragalinales archaeon]|nr:cytochrome c biogenesis protein CcdA [Candidatus Norongarragalinales archaeon]
PLAFLAGLFSFLSPCVLPLVPAFLTFLAGTSASKTPSRRRIFLSSLFFVLGFSLVFSLLGVLLQSVLSGAAYEIRTYLGYLGGAFIILFGLLLMGLIRIDVLESEHKLKAPKTPFSFLTAFLFGASFAVGWTPCVGPVLGSVLTLAATQPSGAFFLMAAYSLGLGLPFLMAGIFLGRAKGFLSSLSPHLKWLNVFFGIVLIVLGILVFTNKLSAVANLFPVFSMLGFG